MGAFPKAFMCLLLLMGASCVIASSAGKDGQNPGWCQEQGILPAGVLGAGLMPPTGEPAKSWGSSLEISGYRLSTVAMSTSAVASGSFPETASLPTPGALSLFVTAMIGAGVIAHKKRREKKHEALSG